MAETGRYAHFMPSQRTTPPGTRVGAADPDARVSFSVYLKPQTEADGPMSREDLAARRAEALQPSIAAVEAFARNAGLSVDETDPARRLLRLSGTVAQAEAAFRTSLHRYHHEGVEFRGREGALQLPENLHGIVEAVLGLDTRPQAETRFRFADAVSQSFLPNAVGAAYGFPTSATGAGQCIGIIELGGGYTESDTQAAFSAMGLQPPSISAVSVDGGSNAPTPDDGANGEVALDIQVAGGNAPGATIAVYFAPNTDAGFADAISQAVHDTANKPAILSISWGSAESNWTAQAVSAMNSALQDAATIGVSVFVASGDNLATDGVTDGQVHVDFPAASPWAIGCGGTSLTASGGGISETVWNDGTSGTGGGISALAAVPSFQSSVTLPANASTGGTGRGVPDVSGNAAPGTGYQVVVNGQTQVVGGTSAVAPLWAGLTALVNQINGRAAGFFLPTLYAAGGQGTRDVVSGNNRVSSGLGYDAGPGWDACTGLGSPDGGAIAGALAGVVTS